MCVLLESNGKERVILVIHRSSFNIHLIMISDSRNVFKTEIELFIVSKFQKQCYCMYFLFREGQGKKGLGSLKSGLPISVEFKVLKIHCLKSTVTPLSEIMDNGVL